MYQEKIFLGYYNCFNFKYIKILIFPGTPVPKGTAAAISAVPVVTETPVGGGILECTRFLPQILVRGEHVVLINIFER